jgi:tau tubulin kinase
LNSHAGCDLGRRDDLWSLFFLLIEFAAPPLQWKSQRDKNSVAGLKRLNLNHMCTGLPSQFSDFLQHLMGLQFEDTPDDELLAGLLSSLCEGTDADAEWGACMSETYGSMTLIVAPNTGSVIGSSSKVEGSWALEAAPAPHSSTDQEGPDDAPVEGGCCLLL